MRALVCGVALARRVLVVVKVRLAATALFGVWRGRRVVRVVGDD